jgi:predicted RNase H-like nuclease (RuvC/YqgF family)
MKQQQNNKLQATIEKLNETLLHQQVEIDQLKKKSESFEKIQQQQIQQLLVCSINDISFK